MEQERDGSFDHSTRRLSKIVPVDPFATTTQRHPTSLRSNNGTPVSGGAMTTPHPINQAVIAQALHDLRSGQLRRCKAMGFATEDLAALKEPVLLSALLHTRVLWCTVQINRNVLQRILKQAGEVEHETAMIDRMLRLGASTEMVARFHGLTHQEIALRRDVLGLPKRKGRRPVLTEEQDTLLWHWLQPHLRAAGVSTVDESAMLKLSLDLAEEHSFPVSVVWATLQGWIADGLI
jgi:hypothetical protein